MDVSPRPNLLWRLFVLVGLGTAGAVTVSDEAWERWHGVAGDTIPRDVMRSVFVVSAALHVAEGGAAYARARRVGLDRPGRWARSTVLWGFPVLRRLTRAAEGRTAEGRTAAPIAA